MECIENYDGLMVINELGSKGFGGQLVGWCHLFPSRHRLQVGVLFEGLMYFFVCETGNIIVRHLQQRHFEVQVKVYYYKRLQHTVVVQLQFSFLLSLVP